VDGSLQGYVPRNITSATTQYDYETYHPPYAKIEKVVHTNRFVVIRRLEKNYIQI